MFFVWQVQEGGCFLKHVQKVALQIELYRKKKEQDKIRIFGCTI